MVTCQSANELKTPAKVSWAFKMVSQFGSLGYTIMRKTADLTVVQKTIIDTLHKEGNHKHSLPKKLAVHRVLYPSMLTESWVEGKSVEEKDAQPTKRTYSLMRIVKQNRFKNLGELHKEWTEAGVKASRATTHRRVKEFGYSCHQRRLTWTKEKKNWTVAQWSKVVFSDESKFCISFGNQGPRVWRKGGEAHSPSCLKSSVKFPQSVMIWGQCHLLVLVHCVFWKPTSLHPFTKKLWRTSCFLLLTSILKMLISFSSMIWHLPTLPKASNGWLNDHGVGVLDWPANSPDLNPIGESMEYCQEENEKQETRKCRWAEGHCQKNLDFPQQYHKLITSMPRRIEAVIKAKGAPTKYWVHTCIQ